MVRGRITSSTARRRPRTRAALVAAYNDRVPTNTDCIEPIDPGPRTSLPLRVLIPLSNGYRRLLAVFLAIVGPAIAYRITATLARVLYRSIEPIRSRSEAQCRAALARRVPPDDITRIAEQAFVHRVWNLTDLMLADRFLHAGTFHRYGGRLSEEHLAILLGAKRQRHPVILVTAYYGPFDLLPVFLGYNGIRAGVIYKPHPNASFDAYRRRIRGRSGCELIPLQQAAGRVAAILENGGTVAIVADHHAEHRGVPVTFLGLPTMAHRSVGLLAEHYGASMAVAGIRRIAGTFRFEIDVADILHRQDWASAEDPVDYITRRYTDGLERLVLRDPSQYLWSYPRWGEALARQLLEPRDASAPRD
jgi:lauroyl/myristoyl acyltransferase